MRHIQIDVGLRLRFPDRSPEFDEGVEIGVLAALMSLSAGAFSHRVSTGSLDQVRRLAPKLGYHLVIEASDGEWSDVSFQTGPERPRLTLAHSRPTPPLGFAGRHGPEPGATRRAELRCV